MPAIALPVSLIATFLGLFIFDLSINIFILLSFILAIGIITDDSVIMTDAIYRRIEQGETPLVAAFKGSRQITFAIVATTLILVAVFASYIYRGNSWYFIPRNSDCFIFCNCCFLISCIDTFSNVGE